MSQKRQYNSDQEDSYGSAKKHQKKTRSKTSDILDTMEKAEKLTKLIQKDMSFFTSMTDTTQAFEHLKILFKVDNLPPIIHQHQIYSMIQNKTAVDREIESLRASNKVRLFKADSNLEDISICSTDDFKNHIKTHVLNFNDKTVKEIISHSKTSQSEFKCLIEKFQNEILNEFKELSITEFELKKNYHLTESEITVLIQIGLLTIKNPSSWWFAIPFVGTFRKNLTDARKSLLNVLKKKKYKEASLEELYKRDVKKINQIGLIYLISDLIGKEEICKMDSPMGFIIKLNEC